MCTLDIIVNEMKSKNITQKDLCEYLGISKQAFTNWKNGNNTSYIKYLPQISQLLDVSIEYLLGKDKKKLPTSANETDVSNAVLAGNNKELENLLNLFDELHPDDQKTLLEHARFLASRKNGSTD
ncbi:helix-turn-helix transcriptional regulator [Paludicola sp. MB14-C6]|uniref:helix-turn-helix domain-containing protein n=1 Tax=Paludihabitans sp. MB14-C6 TaxID=3070656 RepID=UPI0027DD8785|nr:helix-turn-helix transcriptional regulator [Paludicola sp. MB14-C6]WMJ23486.1 helix-turn-helix transcriptional regulator [Paludicola sp. MB14-C6]